MLNGDCTRTLTMTDELSEPGRTLYQGAASACLAAFEGRAELWLRAEAAFEKTRGQTSVLSCESRTVHKLLQRLVDAHRMEPQARLVKRSGGMRTLRCPRFTRITPTMARRRAATPFGWKDTICRKSSASTSTCSAATMT